MIYAALVSIGVWRLHLAFGKVVKVVKVVIGIYTVHY